MGFWKRIEKHAWIAGAVAGVLLITVAAVTGQFDVIWRKAVMICLECIGIG